MTPPQGRARVNSRSTDPDHLATVWLPGRGVLKCCQGAGSHTGETLELQTAIAWLWNSIDRFNQHVRKVAGRVGKQTVQAALQSSLRRDEKGQKAKQSAGLTPRRQQAGGAEEPLGRTVARHCQTRQHCVLVLLQRVQLGPYSSRTATTRHTNGSLKQHRFLLSQL